MSDKVYNIKHSIRFYTQLIKDLKSKIEKEEDYLKKIELECDLTCARAKLSLEFQRKSYFESRR